VRDLEVPKDWRFLRHDLSLTPVRHASGDAEPSVYPVRALASTQVSEQDEHIVGLAIRPQK
jgi:hypothetical protein